MNSASVSRLPFLIATALIAAALADPVVESVSNTGLSGSGYADKLTTSAFCRRCLSEPSSYWESPPCAASPDVWRREMGTARHWFGDVARDLSTRSPAKDHCRVYSGCSSARSSC